MGNYFANENYNTDNYINNNSYLDNLKRWERKIKVNNFKKNYKTNNGPKYMNDLKLWSDQIKLNNFINNNQTNNPPDYIKDLQARNKFLEEELNKMKINFIGFSIV